MRSTRPVVTLGETMLVVAQEAAGEFAFHRRLTLGMGGAESNVAIGLARLGTPSLWVGRVGRDAAGDFIERELRAEGVVARVIRDPDAPTGLLLKERPAPGRQVVRYYRSGSAGSRLSPSDILREDVETAHLVHLTGILPALSAEARATTEWVIATARAAGVPVSFDVNFRSRLWDADAARAALRPLLASIDRLFASEDEADLLLHTGARGVSGRQDLAASSAALAALGPSEVVLTQGARGAHGRSPDSVVDVPAAPADVIDTVGAGDAFVAGYLSARLHGAPLEESLVAGTRVAAAACENPGDWEGVPRGLPDESSDPVSR